MTLNAHVFVLSLLLLAPAQIFAQDSGTAAQHSLTVAAGAMDYDLSGTGRSWAGNARGARALTDHLAAEVGVSFASTDFQAGPGTFAAADGHLQYHWRVGRVRPFAGGGIGVSDVNVRGALNPPRFTWSTAGGARIDLTPRLSLLGELRLRGIEVDFGGSTAEYLGGVSWRLGA